MPALVRLEVELVAIERPDGLLVERLLDAGLRVLALHPNQVAAARDRFRVSGGKSDRFDAFVLCELARTDQSSLPGVGARLRSDEGAAGADPRAGGSGRRADGDGQPAARRARAVLARAARAVHAIWTARSRSRSWSAIPARLTRAGWARRAWPAFLARQRYSGRQTARAAAGKLRRAPAGRVGELELGTRRQVVLRLGRDDQDAQRADQASSSARSPGAVRAHPDGRDLPARCSEPPQRDHRRGAARPRSATAAPATPPATRSPPTPARPRSRSSRANAKPPCFRWACNKRLRDAFATLADSTRHWNPWAARPLRPALARGHDHPRALRTLGRAWCRIVWRCWQDRTPYDPARTPRAATTHHSHHPNPVGPRPDLAATQRMAGAAVTRTGGPQGRARSA